MGCAGVSKLPLSKFPLQLSHGSANAVAGSVDHSSPMVAKSDFDSQEVKGEVGQKLISIKREKMCMCAKMKRCCA